MSKAVYILGGMGPQASAELYRQIIVCAEKTHGAADNHDYPEIVLHSVPVPDFISDEYNKAQAQKMLQERLDTVTPDRYNAFAIACNTAHLLADDLQACTKVPLISMIEAVVQETVSRGVSKVGLLASPTTIRTGLYQDAFANFGVEIVTPSQDQLVKVESAIRAVLAGDDTSRHKQTLSNISDQLVARGAQAIILGCTELPVILTGNRYISSTNCLAKAITNRYYDK